MAYCPPPPRRSWLERVEIALGLVGLTIRGAVVLVYGAACVGAVLAFAAACGAL